MEKREYEVLSALNVDNTLIEPARPGSAPVTVELSDKDAKPLLELKRIAPVGFSAEAANQGRAALIAQTTDDLEEAHAKRLAAAEVRKAAEADEEVAKELAEQAADLRRQAAADLEQAQAEADEATKSKGKGKAKS